MSPELHCCNGERGDGGELLKNLGVGTSLEQSKDKIHSPARRGSREVTLLPVFAPVSEEEALTAQPRTKAGVTTTLVLKV